MFPPAESPATAIRVASRPSSAPLLTAHRAVAYACSAATGYRASGERSYSTNSSAARAPSASSRISRDRGPG